MGRALRGVSFLVGAAIGLTACSDYQSASTGSSDRPTSTSQVPRQQERTAPVQRAIPPGSDGRLWNDH